MDRTRTFGQLASFSYGGYGLFGMAHSMGSHGSRPGDGEAYLRDEPLPESGPDYGWDFLNRYDGEEGVPDEQREDIFEDDGVESNAVIAKGTNATDIYDDATNVEDMDIADWSES